MTAQGEENVLEYNSITSPANHFLALWRTGRDDDSTRRQLHSLLLDYPLSGRVISGYPHDDGFGTMLSSDGWKRVSWVFGPEALPMFLGKSEREVCLLLGLDAKWLDAKIEAGKIFTMVIFPSASLDVVLADWDGVTHVLKTSYTSVWPKVEFHLPRIIASSFTQLEEEAGYSFLEVNLAGRDHISGNSRDERYMSLKRIEEIESPSCVQVRQFLWDELGLKPLFRGDGQTEDDNNVLGSKEYLAKNCLLKDIVGAAVVTIDVPHS